MKGKFVFSITFLVLSLSAQAADPVLIKTGREIFASYVNIFGFGEQDSEIQGIFKQNVDRFPRQGLPAEFSNNVVLGMTELGGLFCKRLVDKEKLIPASQRIMFGDVNFKKGPSQFTSGVQEKMFENLALNIWQRDVTADELATLGGGIRAMAATGADSVDLTVQTAQVICTTYVSSLSFLVK